MIQTREGLDNELWICLALEDYSGLVREAIQNKITKTNFVRNYSLYLKYLKKLRHHCHCFDLLSKDVRWSKGEAGPGASLAADGWKTTPARDCRSLLTAEGDSESVLFTENPGKSCSLHLQILTGRRGDLEASRTTLDWHGSDPRLWNAGGGAIVPLHRRPSGRLCDWMRRLVSSWQINTQTAQKESKECVCLCCFSHSNKAPFIPSPCLANTKKEPKLTFWPWHIPKKKLRFYCAEKQVRPLLDSSLSTRRKRTCLWLSGSLPRLGMNCPRANPFLRGRSILLESSSADTLAAPANFPPQNDAVTFSNPRTAYLPLLTHSRQAADRYGLWISPRSFRSSSFQLNMKYEGTMWELHSIPQFDLY